MVPSSPTLRKTPLNAWHRANGGQMVESAGWDMPASYGHASEEHLAVRTTAGLFDLGDTGLVELAGDDALAAIQSMTSNDAGRLDAGQIQHSALTTRDGTFLDELLVYRLAASHFLLTVNAANLKKDVLWILEQAKGFGDVAVVDTSSRYAVVSVQGPASREVVLALTGADLESLGELAFTYGEVAGARATISRTVRCGEDGVDVLVPPQSALRVWQAILQEGADAGVVPAGLHALGALRLEAGSRRYGADIDETTSVLEAGLEAIVAWDKGDFSGRAALAEQKANGLSRRLVGFEMVDAAVAAHGCDAYVGGAKVGVVTSGAESPHLRKAIGLAYLSVAHAETGTDFDVDVHGRRARARVAALPFYQRQKG
jgi:aminomethyltransferase